jgi:hypothetical protein
MNRIAHVRHANIQLSLRDSINSNSSPAVNCRAIFVSPSGRSMGIGSAGQHARLYGRRGARRYAQHIRACSAACPFAIR